MWYTTLMKAGGLISPESSPPRLTLDAWRAGMRGEYRSFLTDLKCALIARCHNTWVSHKPERLNQILQQLNAIPAARQDSAMHPVYPPNPEHLLTRGRRLGILGMAGRLTKEEFDERMKSTLQVYKAKWKAFCSSLDEMRKELREQQKQEQALKKLFRELLQILANDPLSEFDSSLRQQTARALSTRGCFKPDFSLGKAPGGRTHLTYLTRRLIFLALCRTLSFSAWLKEISQGLIDGDITSLNDQLSSLWSLPPPPEPLKIRPVAPNAPGITR